MEIGTTQRKQKNIPTSSAVPEYILLKIKKVWD
jgi:hypothetical protein